MRVVKPFLVLLGLGIVVLLLSQSAKADEWNKETILTFSRPVEVPGMVLPAGSYDFKLMDSPSERNVVQIFSADRSHLYENVLAIRVYRTQPSGKTVVTFQERTQGSPDAIATWFYPGSISGEEFIYPKTSSADVTAAAGPAPTAEPSQTALKVSPGEERTKPAIAEFQPAETAVEGAPEQVAQEDTQATTRPATTESSPAASPQKEEAEGLPNTASPLPLLTLLGFLSLGASAGIHVLSKRSA